jgi:hypothetical protein
VRELKIKTEKIGEGERQCVRGRIKISLSLWHPSITLPWIGGERGRKKKWPPHSTLKRIKVFFFFKTIKGRKERTKKLHFCRQGWGGRHCANATSLA